ncbi:MAG: aminoglycoside phosphotransferase family protein, partial [Acutalibacteraceae bacterium]
HSVTKAGSGAVGSVYKVITDDPNVLLAVKIGANRAILEDEYNMIKFISDRVDCKLPKLYFIDQIENMTLIAMDFIDGIPGDSKILRFLSGKKTLADDIVDNLLKIHSVHNDKFGPVNNAVYDTWYDYYKEYAQEIYDFCCDCHKNKRLSGFVFGSVEKSFQNLDKLIPDNGEKPTLIHGDYWLPNMIINPKTMKLAGVVDPFNIMWTEPEFEIFAMTVGYGKRLKLYETYKEKVKTSELCDLKVELYALYNELMWYKRNGEIGQPYLIMRSKNLLKQMKKHGIK